MHLSPWLVVITLGPFFVAGRSVSLDKSDDQLKHGHETIREPGRCSMYDTCGSNGGIFGVPIPCVNNSPARKVDDSLRTKLQNVCGPPPDGSESWDLACCTSDQVDNLQQSLSQAEALIASCPACKHNFRSFYCSFTCSPDQSEFVTVTDTQDLGGGNGDGPAVKSIAFHVSPEFGSGFYDSCKQVKFGATNGYAMGFIGAGAKDWLSFLRFMGQERPGLGSPFQMNFPQPPETLPGKENSTFTIYPLNTDPAPCYSSDPSLKCACLDCEQTCLELPHIPSPREELEGQCHVGLLSCFSFSIIIIYIIALIGFFVIGLVENAYRSGQPFTWSSLRFSPNLLKSSPSRNDYDRLPLEDPLIHDENEDQDNYINNTSNSNNNIETNIGRQRSRRYKNPLVGAVGQGFDGEVSRRSNDAPSGSSMDLNASSSQNSRHQSYLDPLTANQPRSYFVNTYLSPAFYKIGLFCGKRPIITMLLTAIVCGILNAGWSRFQVEKDPVNLWVAKGSETETVKSLFDQKFGPFYRNQQIFVTPAQTNDYDLLYSEHNNNINNISSSSISTSSSSHWKQIDAPVFNWQRLQWWSQVEKDIRSLQTASGVSFQDICLAPTAGQPLSSDEPCVVQSWLGYFSNSLEGIDQDSWDEILDKCAENPSSCLPPSGQPLNPRLLFGGIPGFSHGFPDKGPGDPYSTVKAHDARSFIVTFVVRNSLDPDYVAKVEQWESELREYLLDLSERALEEAGVYITFSTESSLEQELNKSTNTDVRIVVISYVIMFLYVALNLGKSALAMFQIASAGFVWIFEQIPWRRWFRLDRNTLNDGHGNRARATSVSQSITDSMHSTEDSPLRTLLVESKFSLALVGIAIVLLSVSTAVGFFSFIGIKVTLIIAEVIPFLVLAIGVDNVFILAHEVDRQTSKAISEARQNASFPRPRDPSEIIYGRTRRLGIDDDDYEDDGDGINNPRNNILGNDNDNEGVLTSAEERVAQALARMGPSILLSATCETVAFALGALVAMPAVRNFAAYAAGAVVINTLLQVTVFVSAMVIDLKRSEAGRIDVLWCFKFPPLTTQAAFAYKEDGGLAKFIRNNYAPTLLSYPVKILVLVIFSGLFIASWIGSTFINLGLDQRLALPSDSYLVDYFDTLDTYLDVGPPVYFIEQGLHVEKRKGQLEMCGRFTTCDDFSIANVLEAERKRPESSFLAEPPTVWIDDFFQWLNPVLETCCRVNRRNPDKFCGPNDSEFQCIPCYEHEDKVWNITLEGLPEDLDFMKYLRQWLNSPSDESCPLGGKTGYSDALSLSRNHVEASNFRTFHTPLKTQNDFINALKASRRISNDLSQTTGSQVSAYSLFYIFFDQYLSIQSRAREVVVLALGVVYLITSFFLGSWRTAACVIVSVALSVVNVLGMMGAWNIDLNAISLVNIVISVGISVEFCSHIARSFMGALNGGLPFSHPAGPDDRDDRARAALVDVGPSVFSGITLTKLIGIAVLAMTRSKLLEIYYFRMWLSLIISGALHGLVFLPVLLSFQGGQGYSIEREDEEWTRNAIHDYENRPLLADDDSDSVRSDD